MWWVIFNFLVGFVGGLLLCVDCGCCCGLVSGFDIYGILCMGVVCSVLLCVGVGLVVLRFLSGFWLLFLFFGCSCWVFFFLF